MTGRPRCGPPRCAGSRCWSWATRASPRSSPPSSARTGRTNSPGTGWPRPSTAGSSPRSGVTSPWPTSGSTFTDDSDPSHGEFGFMGHHLRWSRLLLQGRFTEAGTLLDGLAPTDYPYAELLRAITAAESGDDETAIRLTAGIEAASIRYPRPVSPLWLRLRAQVAAASADPQRCDAARAALTRTEGSGWLPLRLRHQRPRRPLAGPYPRRPTTLGRRDRRLHRGA
ncbi:hypothetical protein NKG94_28205 [Micromonospora sp. M12]